MSSNWPTVTLQEITSVLGDGLHGTPKYDKHGEYYFINGNNLSNGRIVITDKTKRSPASEYEKHKKKLNDRTILVSINGTLGNVALYNGEHVFLGKSACYFNVKSDVDRLYIRYVLENRDFQDYIHNLATGSTIKNVSLKLMREFSFKLPPFHIQKRISEILGELDEKVQLNKQINQTLEQMAQAIFKSWFVDFEPVKAKITALEAGGSEEDALLAAMQAISGKGDAELTRFQAEQPEQYAELRATAELFPSAMQDSELGEIPEGWRVSPISDFGRIVCGKTPSKQKSEFYGGHIPFIKIPDMHGNMFATTTSDHLSPVGAASQPKKAIPKGSVCVSCIATVGQVVIATEESHTNQQINSIIPFEDNYTAYLYFRMESLYEHLHDLASGGSATLNLNTGSFSRIQILMPSDSILAGYAKSCAALLDRILCNMEESQSLSILRDTLLPKLLSGELSISDAENQLAEEAELANV